MGLETPEGQLVSISERNSNSMGIDDDRWFEVTATIKVKATDENDAINRAAGAIRHGYKKAPGVYPVGSFDARETTDPLAPTWRRISDTPA